MQKYIIETKHCVKTVQIRSFFWSVFSRIRTWKNSVLGHISSSEVFDILLADLFWLTLAAKSIFVYSHKIRSKKAKTRYLYLVPLVWYIRFWFVKIFWKSLSYILILTEVACFLKEIIGIISYENRPQWRTILKISGCILVKLGSS